MKTLAIISTTYMHQMFKSANIPKLNKHADAKRCSNRASSHVFHFLVHAEQLDGSNAQSVVSKTLLGL